MAAIAVTNKIVRNLPFSSSLSFIANKKVGRQEKNGEETNRVSAFMNMEAWRKNEHTESFDKLTKGTLLTVEGFFKPEEWTDKDGVKHSRIIMVATKFYECPDKEETPAEEPAKPATKKGKK